MGNADLVFLGAVKRGHLSLILYTCHQNRDSLGHQFDQVLAGDHTTAAVR